MKGTPGPVLAPVLAVALLTAACGWQDRQATGPSARPSAGQADTAQAVAPPLAPASDAAILADRDCRKVIRFYTDALRAADFTLAARVWPDSSGVTAKVLEQRFEGKPALLSFDSAQIREEGAAGSLYCSVDVSLAQPDGSARKGAITLRRVNDVPGATAEQLRWHIERSPFAEAPGG